MTDEGGRGASSGPSTDRHNDPVVDPTPNVLDLVSAAVLRQDDLRNAEREHIRAMADLQAQFTTSEREHIRELLTMRGQFDDKLRLSEANRIDAIRAVDVAASQQASKDAETRATALAGQVAASAEAMRNQVTAAATAATVSLGAALVPIQEAIADLRRVQYEGVGQKTQVVERQAQGASTGLWIGVAIAVVSLLVTALFGLYAINRENPSQPGVVTVTTPNP